MRNLIRRTQLILVFSLINCILLGVSTEANDFPAEVYDDAVVIDGKTLIIHIRILPYYFRQAIPNIQVRNMGKT